MPILSGEDTVKEVIDICRAYAQAKSAGIKAALATVVRVEGSSYRRPGARMLVTEDGQLTGAISGGCLEGDALRKALFAIEQRRNKLVVYDTSDEDSAVFGVQLGCNGIVHILFEPIDPGKPDNPIKLLEALAAGRKPAIVATLFNEDRQAGDHPGTCVLYRDDKVRYGELTETLRAPLLTAIVNAKRRQTSSFARYGSPGAWYVGFIDYIPPPVALVIAGAGNDAIPLASMAAGLGWHVHVIDGRPTHATTRRFAGADSVHVVKPGAPVPGLMPDEKTAYVIMTHNYHYDLAVLKRVLSQAGFYIGVLGPRQKLDLMLNELAAAGTAITPEQRQRLYGPAGLDTAAETAEEIALAIAAEIQAVARGGGGAFLRDKSSSIHART